MPDRQMRPPEMRKVSEKVDGGWSKKGLLGSLLFTQISKSENGPTLSKKTCLGQSVSKRMCATSFSLLFLTKNRPIRPFFSEISRKLAADPQALQGPLTTSSPELSSLVLSTTSDGVALLPHRRLSARHI